MHNSTLLPEPQRAAAHHAANTNEFCRFQTRRNRTSLVVNHKKQRLCLAQHNQRTACDCRQHTCVCVIAACLCCLTAGSTVKLAGSTSVITPRTGSTELVRNQVCDRVTSDANHSHSLILGVITWLTTFSLACASIWTSSSDQSST